MAAELRIKIVDDSAPISGGAEHRPTPQPNPPQPASKPQEQQKKEPSQKKDDQKKDDQKKKVGPPDVIPTTAPRSTAIRTRGGRPANEVILEEVAKREAALAAAAKTVGSIAATAVGGGAVGGVVGKTVSSAIGAVGGMLGGGAKGAEDTAKSAAEAASDGLSDVAYGAEKAASELKKAARTVGEFVDRIKVSNSRGTPTFHGGVSPEEWFGKQEELLKTVGGGAEPPKTVGDPRVPAGWSDWVDKEQSQKDAERSKELAEEKRKEIDKEFADLDELLLKTVGRGKNRPPEMIEAVPEVVGKSEHPKPIGPVHQPQYVDVDAVGKAFPPRAPKRPVQGPPPPPAGPPRPTFIQQTVSSIQSSSWMQSVTKKLPEVGKPLDALLTTISKATGPGALAKITTAGSNATVGAITKMAPSLGPLAAKIVPMIMNPVGLKIALVVGGIVAVVGGAVIAFKLMSTVVRTVTGTLMKMSESFAMYSTDIQKVNAQREVEKSRSAMRKAKRYGPTIARATQLSNRLDKVMDKWGEMLLKIMTTLFELLEPLLSHVVTGMELITNVFDVITEMSTVVTTLGDPQRMKDWAQNLAKAFGEMGRSLIRYYLGLDTKINSSKMDPNLVNFLNMKWV